MAYSSRNSRETSPPTGSRINARVARSVLLATCFMVCGSTAWSQSREYKRGYDAGFEAGRSSVRNGDHRGDRHEDGRRDARIRVLDANYGRGRRVCDARPAVQRFVDQRGEGTFQVSNDLCGDPAPNESKALDVTYQCGRDNPVRVTANEGDALRIRCR